MNPEAKPLPVTIAKQPQNPLETLRTYVEPILAPLGTAALVLLFVIFFLIEREDMRDRLIHMIGRGHLQVTTQALDEAGNRVSKYLVAQLLVNVCYGLLLAIGLFFLKIPNALLWGLVSTMCRFVPYVGPWVAAAFPVLLSLAITPGWTLPIITFALYLVVEIVCSNVLEPWLYGSSTGMSPLAIIAAAAFWTWLWGTVGLLLSTPLTVCIAVLGKYLPGATFLDVLLGDKPPIAPEDRVYQRLLAHDEDEALELIEQRANRNSAADAFDHLVIPTLRLTDEDFHAGSLTDADRCRVVEDLFGIITDLGAPDPPKSKDREKKDGKKEEGDNRKRAAGGRSRSGDPYHTGARSCR